MRLTISLRQKIVESESKKKFEKALIVARQELINTIEKEVKSSVEVRFSEKTLNSGYVKLSNSFEFLSDSRSVKKTLGILSYSLSKQYPIKSTYGGHKIAEKGDVAKKIKKIKSILSEKKAFETELKLVLNSFTTSKKLLKHLPEFKSYIPMDIGVTALVPVAQIEKVKKQLVKRTS